MTPEMKTPEMKTLEVEAMLRANVRHVAQLLFNAWEDMRLLNPHLSPWGFAQAARVAAQSELNERREESL